VSDFDRCDCKVSCEDDLAKLDLTIEKVDERISPSETNVFDKQALARPASPRDRRQRAS
jgi:hypothetical protein